MPSTQNRKLTYDALDKLIAEDEIHLEVANVDVKRLRDDRSEIVGGQDIAFVATATFRATSNTATILKEHVGNGNIAVGDALFVIGADAEVRSEGLEIDEDSVALWLDKHYAFTFTLNGVDDTGDGPFQDLGAVAIAPTSPNPHEPTLVLPWLRKLNTGVFKDGYIDVDVRITENDLDPPAGSTVQWTMEPGLAVRFIKTTTTAGQTEPQDATFHLVLEVDDTEDSPSELGKDGLRVALEGAPTGVRLALIPQIHDASGAKRKSAELARGAATTTPPKHKP